MDRILRRELAAIAGDRRSGAAELAFRAARAIRAWLMRRSEPSEIELLAVANELLRAQPSMAPLLRLGNEVALAAETSRRGRHLASIAGRFADHLRRAPSIIGRLFALNLRSGMGRQVATYSFSATVLEALLRAGSRVREVICSESRPGCEGRTTAARLARAGVAVVLATDAALMSRIGQTSLLVLGADAVLASGFVNKIGSGALAQMARAAGKPVWILADTSKFLPSALAERILCFPQRERGEVWRTPRRGIAIANPYFEFAEYVPGIRILTERGWFSPRRIARACERLRVAGRLELLAD